MIVRVFFLTYKHLKKCVKQIQDKDLPVANETGDDLWIDIYCDSFEETIVGDLKIECVVDEYLLINRYDYESYATREEEEEEEEGKERLPNPVQGTRSVRGGYQLRHQPTIESFLYEFGYKKAAFLMALYILKDEEAYYVPHGFIYVGEIVDYIIKQSNHGFMVNEFQGTVNSLFSDDLIQMTREFGGGLFVKLTNEGLYVVNEIINRVGGPLKVFKNVTKKSFKKEMPTIKSKKEDLHIDEEFFEAFILLWIYEKRKRFTFGWVVSDLFNLLNDCGVTGTRSSFNNIARSIYKKLFVKGFIEHGKVYHDMTNNGYKFINKNLEKIKQEVSNVVKLCNKQKKHTKKHEDLPSWVKEFGDEELKFSDVNLEDEILHYMTEKNIRDTSKKSITNRIKIALEPISRLPDDFVKQVYNAFDELIQDGIVDEITKDKVMLTNHGKNLLR